MPGKHVLGLDGRGNDGMSTVQQKPWCVPLSDQIGPMSVGFLRTVFHNIARSVISSGEL